MTSAHWGYMYGLLRLSLASKDGYKVDWAEVGNRILLTPMLRISWMRGIRSHISASFSENESHDATLTEFRTLLCFLLPQDNIVVHLVSTTYKVATGRIGG